MTRGNSGLRRIMSVRTVRKVQAVPAYPLLWISQFPPIAGPAAGSQTFSYYFWQAVRSGRFSVRLAACAKPADQEKIEAALRDVDHHIIYWAANRKERLRKAVNLESKYNPWNRNGGLIQNTDERILRGLLSQWKREGYSPRAAVLEWTNMAPLARHIRALFPDCRIVISEHDVTYVSFSRRAAYYQGLPKAFWTLKSRTEKRVELDALRRSDRVAVQSPKDLTTLGEAGVAPEKLFRLMPYYHDMSAAARLPNGRDILFFGDMSRRENELTALFLVRRVLPLLAQRDVRLVVLGSGPSEELRKLSGPRVEVTGFVPDIAPWFESACCFAAPLALGAGIKVKVLEALSSGMPVITNQVGAEGIPIRDGVEYVHAETPEETAAAIGLALDGRLDEIGRAGQTKILNECRLEGAARRYLDLLSSLMEG